MKETKKSNLDERQEQILLNIEKNGFWLAFWLLVAAMGIQIITSGGDLKVFGGECVTLFIISLYVAIECIRNGIWDRRLQAKTSTNIIASLIAGLGLGTVNALSFMKYFEKPFGAIAAGALVGVFTFLLCMVALSISMSIYMKRREIMDEEPKEDLDDTEI